MSSALLKKRIMLSMEAESVFGDIAVTTNSTQIAKDCPYPIEKLSIGSESTSDSRTGTRESDDEANKNITVAGQTIQSDASDTAATRSGGIGAGLDSRDSVSRVTSGA